jgi:hypothetical protein
MNERNDQDDGSWTGLANRHRRSNEHREDAAPFGFSARVAAQWREIRRGEVFAAWERLSWRAALASSVVAVVVAGFSFHWEQTAAPDADEWMLLPDAGGAEPEILLP